MLTRVNNRSLLPPVGLGIAWIEDLIVIPFVSVLSFSSKPVASPATATYLRIGSLAQLRFEVARHLAPSAGRHGVGESVRPGGGDLADDLRRDQLADRNIDRKSTR